MKSGVLVSSANAQTMDREAAEWGLNSHALVEAAGRLCAQQLITAFPQFTSNEARQGKGFPVVYVLAGSGNNAADALVMLRALVVMGNWESSLVRVLFTKLPALKEHTPLSDAFRSIQQLGIAFDVWNSGSVEQLGTADLIIDGLAGTGLKGPLAGTAAEIAEAVNILKSTQKTIVISIDLPSGNGDEWQPGMPLIHADATLAIEPEKLCLYTPVARRSAGRIIPVKGIFPGELMNKYREAAVYDWKCCSSAIEPVLPDVYKYQRGLVEIWAGSPGATGAAMLAARGAQAAGAGLVRLVVDDSIYPLLAVNSGGIMVIARSDETRDSAVRDRFKPDAILVGPGWGRGQDRSMLLEKLFSREAQGIPLILDADAIALARDHVFNGNALLTPHPGEFAEYTGHTREDIRCRPIPLMHSFAEQKKVHILLKGHVLFIASPPVQQDSGEGTPHTGIIDGMNPSLAQGGTGDVLAGFCAAIAGRMAAEKRRDLFACATAAATLLLEAGRTDTIHSRFIDPHELIRAAAGIAGKAWLGTGSTPNDR